MDSLKEHIQIVLSRYYPTGLTVGQIIQELPGTKKPRPALVNAVLSELLEDQFVQADHQKGLWYGQ